jgi:hypothetical protein
MWKVYKINKLFAHSLDCRPIFIGNPKPFAFAWPNIDVNTGKTIVLQMTRCSTPGHFEVKLNSVHPKDSVAQVTEHIAGRGKTAKWWKFIQFLIKFRSMDFLGVIK